MDMDVPVKHKSLDELWESSAFAGSNAAYLDDLYESYLNNPDTVSNEWRALFDNLPTVNSEGAETSHSAVKEQLRQLVKKHTPIENPSTATDEHNAKQVRVLQMINAFRFLGHQSANLNPLTRELPELATELTLAHHQLSEEDLHTVFNCGSLVGPETATLNEIVDIVRSTYCRCIGSEYMHITDTTEKRWIQNFLESRRGTPSYAPDVKRELLQQIMIAEGLEQYLHTKYIGQKRFSLEGGESLIPLLKGLIQRGGEKHDIKEMAVGMAHRGRLNVLVNIMGKTPVELFSEFEGKARNKTGMGDVKYHMGFSSELDTPGGPIHVALAFNPSHLEIIGPVVEGSVRARQDRRGDKQGKKVVPILIHGDAAFSGQGVVMETFNMSQSRGYSTKGTIHIVINNQIGFTTSNQEDARSTLYCTDVAKMVNAPIFHVNGDDPEAVLMVAQLALDYRMTFFKDVVIDMVCYRRHGHSEADEPMATQPVMYQHIKAIPTTQAVYSKKLLNEGIVTQQAIEQKRKEYRASLDAGHSVIKVNSAAKATRYTYIANWSEYTNRDYNSEATTRVEAKRLRTLAQKLAHIPDGFKLHPNVAKIMTAREQMAAGQQPIDWGFAEIMAYATLLSDGFSIRLSGQDSGRGTFFHRHSVLHNQLDGSTYIPLRHLGFDKANFLVINSLLSEEAVLAFEYGYATTDPLTLTIWEAQFGDFANNAQVVIDQFISAGEQKWNRLSGLVMLLPHGFEGQGSEHSSARLERYLQLCAQHNIQVVVPTTAAQIFHLLRRQMLMKCRRPLIVMSPKSLLRLPAASSELSALTKGTFKTVIPEVDDLDDANVKRIILCSGKVFYDLIEKRRQKKIEDIAIIRIEQLYPFPDDTTRAQVKRYHNAVTFIWCQEEPMNQGAWYSSQHHMRAAIGHDYYLEYAGRPPLAAPAAGYLALHKKQQNKLVDDALGLNE
jgi:2-oxoglutarate dehydrogenase E1 component